MGWLRHHHIWMLMAASGIAAVAQWAGVFHV